jgi:fluoroacetyl-CoA thioesterase
VTKPRGKSRRPAPRKQRRSSKRQSVVHGLPLGLKSSVERVVPFEWTIAAYDSHLPAVFSTPAMIGMMEVAAAQAIAPELPQGTISVGTRIEVDHLKAVPPGTAVEAHAKLVGANGRFLIFEAEARAGEVVIGRGRVFRAIVPLAPFTDKVSQRG